MLLNIIIKSILFSTKNTDVKLSMVQKYNAKYRIWFTPFHTTTSKGGLSFSWWNKSFYEFLFRAHVSDTSLESWDSKTLYHSCYLPDNVWSNKCVFYKQIIAWNWKFKISIRDLKKRKIQISYLIKGKNIVTNRQKRLDLSTIGLGRLICYHAKHILVSLLFYCSFLILKTTFL